jgi:hypothetical protein
MIRQDMNAYSKQVDYINKVTNDFEQLDKHLVEYE